MSKSLIFESSLPIALKFWYNIAFEYNSGMFLLCKIENKLIDLSYRMYAKNYK